jgi:hypothetical protein
VKFNSAVRGPFSTIPWLIAAYGLWSYLGSYWAPEACLDVEHASFDYRTWQCSQEQQDYIETAMYNVPGFWFAVVSLSVAVLLTALVRHVGRQQREKS